MKRWFFVPPVLAVLAVTWMSIAVSHYERTTGREFYGLAGYYSTWPKEVFHPSPGAEAIERWVVFVPSLAIGSLLAASGIFFTVLSRSAGIARISLGG